MAVDPALAIAGLVVGFTVGLTGVGGGALMTPVLILLFGVNPMTAVSSDLVVSLLMKPIGGGVHWRRGTVRLDLVKWLCLGSVPSAFAGALILDALGPGSVAGLLKKALGVALLASATSLILRKRLQKTRTADPSPIEVRPLVTVAIGAVGGLIVGLTSVGSGSLIIVALLAAYPRLSPASLVGTDLVQAIPLVASAALGHLLFGSVELSLTAALLVGAIPGVYAGARLSSRAPEGVVRSALVTVFVGTGLKLVQVI
jgi:uncharacterized membrane protein YfcA